MVTGAEKLLNFWKTLESSLEIDHPPPSRAADSLSVDTTATPLGGHERGQD